MRYRPRERDEGRALRSPLRWTDRVIEAGVLFLLVFTPLAFGTVEPWSEAIAELVVLGMVVAWMIGMVRDWELRIEPPPAWLPAALFLALVFLQATPLPRFLLDPVAAWNIRQNDGASVYLVAAGFPLVPVSLAPHATWREALKLGAVAAFFLVCYNTYRTRGQLKRAVWTMIIVATLISVFGIVQRMTWNGRLYWIGPEAPAGAGYSFGPFVNRTHFAEMIVVVAPVALAIFLAGRRQSERSLLVRRWRDRLRQPTASGSGPTHLVPFLVALLGGAALVAGSRGGVVAFLVALLAMVALGSYGPSGASRARRVAVLGTAAVLAGIWIGGDVFSSTVERLMSEVGQPEESGRLHLWGNLMRLWYEAPSLGTGLATFGTVFPQVRAVPAPLLFTHAESDWAQLLTDTGVVGLALVFGLVGAQTRRLFDRYLRPEQPAARALSLSALVAVIGAVVQGVANFNAPVMSGLIYLSMSLTVGLRPSGAGAA